MDTYGLREKPCILLLHTMSTTGTLFEALIPALVQDYFLVIPTLDGYDPDGKAEYLGADEELERIEAYLKGKQIRELAVVAGSSLGVMLAWRLWQRHQIPIHRLALDSPSFGWGAVQAAENTESLWQLVQAVRAAPETSSVSDAHYGECGAPVGTSLGIRLAVSVKRALALSCRSIFQTVAQESFWLTTGGTPITSIRRKIWGIGRIFSWW